MAEPVAQAPAVAGGSPLSATPAAAPAGEPDVAAGVAELAPPAAAEAAGASKPPAASDVESFLPDCISNAARLLETVLHNDHSCRAFLDAGGLDALLALYSLPSLPLAFGASAAAHNMSTALRVVATPHSAVVSRAVATAVRARVQSAVALVTTSLTSFATVDASAAAQGEKSESALIEVLQGALLLE